MRNLNFDVRVCAYMALAWIAGASKLLSCVGGVFTGPTRAVALRGGNMREDVIWALGSTPQVVSPRCCESDSGLRSETGPRSEGESESAKERKTFPRMGTRGRAFVIGVTKGLR